MLKSRPLGLLALAGIAAAGLVTVGYAQRPPADAAAYIDQRQARMKALGGSMKILTGVAKGEGSIADARKAAATLVSARDMHRWWPQGTEKGVSDSDAAPAIWTERARFNRNVIQYRNAAALMDKAARSGDLARVRAAFPAVGASCKSCHTRYRLED